jgi:hypothetical protein
VLAKKERGVARRLSASLAAAPGLHEPGTGELPFPGILEALAAAGCTGAIDLEFAPLDPAALDLGCGRCLDSILGAPLKSGRLPQRGGRRAATRSRPRNGHLITRQRRGQRHRDQTVAGPDRPGDRGRPDGPQPVAGRFCADGP